MFARTIRLAAVLLSLSLLGACSSDPSTMLRVPANGPMPQAIDERTGVVGAMELLPDGTYETSLRRIEDGAYVTLTPPIPDGHAGRVQSVAWHEGRALAADLDGHLFRFTPETAAWETLALGDCDPTLAYATLADAPAMDHAWVVATDYTAATLCHFDGSGFDAAESLAFVPGELVEHEGALYATDETGQVLRRAIGDTAWSRVIGVPVRTIDQLVVRGDGVYVRQPQEDGTSEWWRASGVPARIEGFPGLGGERWRVEETTRSHEHCGESWFDGHTYCSNVVDVLEEHVLRVDGATPVEVGMAHFEHPGSLWFEMIAVGPGQLALTSSSGDVFVTAAE